MRKIILSYSMIAVAALLAGFTLAACGDSTPTAARGPAVTTPVTIAGQATPAPITSGATSATAAGAGTATTAAATNSTVNATATTTAAATTGVAASCARLNLNTVTEAQLMSGIPGFSARMVREFMEYRPYSSIAQFRKEIGKYVSAAQVTEWEKYVYVPVDPKTSDIETLKQLPGVDNTVAAALAAGRPYASNSAFMQALTARVTPQQLSQASCYLVA